MFNFSKSPRLDGITNDMLKGSPQQVARHLHPLLCKMSLGCKELLMLKGSLATDLLRSRLLSVWRISFVTRSAVPKHRCRHCQSVAAVFSCKSVSIETDGTGFFFDVKTAFYAVIRQTLFPVPLSREEYLDVLDSVDIPLPLVLVLEEAVACPALVPEITSVR